MNKRNPQNMLQDYLSDLLLESEATADQPFQPAPQPRPLPAAPSGLRDAPAFADEPAVEFSALEQSKREKLQALLNSKPLVEASVKAPVAEVETSTRVEVVEEPVLPQTVVDMAEETPADVDEPEVEVTTEADTTAAVSHYLAWNDNGRPEWAQSRFDALLFDVAGLTLAVPLIALGQIYPLTGELTPLFGQADWFMGLLPTPNGKIRTINTALFVMPEKYDTAFVETAKYVVSIDGVPWGLAVDRVNQPISLDPDDVKWRSERTKRPWLAGTVKSAMCALIDIPQMGQMLTTADKNHAVR